MKERLIPVKSESELRIGMILVLKRCGSCKASHRILLLAPDGRTGIHRDSSSCPRGWKMAVSLHGIDQLCLCKCLHEGRLFRVDDGMDAETLGARSSNPKSLVRS